MLAYILMTIEGGGPAPSPHRQPPAPAPESQATQAVGGKILHQGMHLEERGGAGSLWCHLVLEGAHARLHETYAGLSDGVFCTVLSELPG